MNKPRPIYKRMTFLGAVLGMSSNMVAHPVSNEAPVIPVPEMRNLHSARHAMHEFDVGMMRIEDGKEAGQFSPARPVNVIRLAWQLHPKNGQSDWSQHHAGKRDPSSFQQQGGWPSAAIQNVVVL